MRAWKANIPHVFLKPYFWVFTWSPTGESSGNLWITWKLWVNEAFVPAVSCHERSGIVFMHPYTHRHSRWGKDGHFHQSLSPAHGGALKVAVSFLSLTVTLSLSSYPLVYLSTVSVHTSLILPVSLSPLLSLSVSLTLSFSLFSYWCVSLPFWSFLVPDLRWSPFLSCWPAGMRGSYQTSQMVGFFLVLESWPWNDTLVKAMTVAADMSSVGNKFTTRIPTASEKL